MSLLTEEKFRALVETLNDVIFEVTVDGRLVYISPVVERVLGYPVEEVVGRPYELLIHPEDRMISRHALDDVLGDSPRPGEYRMCRKDGSLCWVQSSSRPVRDPDGRITAIRGVLADITERKKTERELQRAASEWEQTFNAAPDLIAILNREHLIVRTNNAMAARLGAGPVGLFGQCYHRLVYGTDEPPEFCPHVAVFKDGREHTAEIAVERLGGTFAISASPLRDSEDHVWGDVFVARDITARKRAEEELLASKAQLRALTRHLQNVRENERARIAREIHDELGQMLTGVKMDLRWIERRLEQLPNDPNVNPILDKAVEASELVDQTVHVMHHIASELRPSLLDRMGLLMALRHEAGEFQARTGVACRIHAQDDSLMPGPEVAITLFRIFQEALTNVVRHAEASAVAVCLEMTDDEYRMEIRDNGKGIDERAVNRRGALGLLGMRERAEALGGAASIRRGQGGGSVVNVSIPKESVDTADPSLRTGE